MLLIAIGLLFGLVLLLWCFVLLLIRTDSVSEKGDRASPMRHELRPRSVRVRPRNLC
jgi:hypothetical protein